MNLAERQDYYQHRVLGAPHCWVLLEAPKFLILVYLPEFVQNPYGGSTFTSHLPMNFWATMLVLNWEHDLEVLRTRGVEIAKDLRGEELRHKFVPEYAR